MFVIRYDLKPLKSPNRIPDETTYILNVKNIAMPIGSVGLMLVVLKSNFRIPNSVILIHNLIT